ncbi:hypothetical protein I4U23_021797 [Adineta vaga]|nr:hypothetical protein I4U23_021797 [Adineta vaga]
MKCLNDNKQFKQSLELFDKYKKNNLKSFSSLLITQALKACTHLKDYQTGLNIHHLISSRINNDSYILASLINFYIKCGNMKDAQVLFESSTKRSLSMYATMMKGYLKTNQANESLNLFNQIKNPDDVIIILLFNTCAQLETNEALNLVKKVSKEIPKTYYSNPRLLTSLLDALIKCDDMKYAQVLFSKSSKKTVSMYGAMMNGFNLENNPSKTLNLFNEMKRNGIEPSFITYTCVIQALSQIGDYSFSQSIIKQIPQSIFVDNQIHNALINMWGKTGHVDKAEEIFKKISQVDQIGYSAMINSYGLNGMGIQAIKLYYQIPLELINESIQICVLNACSHSGLVDEACLIFKNISIKTERIYTTMIDCFSRASFFNEAQQLIDEYEHSHSPSLPMYMALLSGARNRNNIHLSQNVYDRMKKLFLSTTNSLVSAAVLLANVYGSLGDIDKAKDIRIQLHQSNTKKKIGLTWTHVNGQLYQFRAHDQSHPRSDEIYAEIKKMSQELIEHGHQYDSSWITRSLNETETVESVLCGHSERLAIAWNFVANPNVSQIQLTKNLRVCGDCHRATKLIAAIRQCEIIVRDANRIHHFYTNGQCSCNDYF